MISNILVLYFLGLTILLFSDFLGLSFFGFRTVSIYLGVLFGYLSIVVTYAIFKSNMNSIGMFVLLWLLGYFFLIQKRKESPKIKKQDYLKRLFIISFLWSVIFLIKVSFFWNTAYNCPNLLFVDYEFYMKIAEGYNLNGNENALGLKNALFPFLNFAQPYRSNDIWLVSLGLDITNMDTIYIWELFYSTVIICICSLSLFVLFKRKFNLLGSLVLSVLALFAFSGNWYRGIINLIYTTNSGGYDPIGIIAYSKLAIVFSIFFQFFYKYESGKKIEAIYFLILIPLLVQSAIAVFLIIFLIILISIYQERKFSENSIKKYLTIIVIFIILFVGFLLFYKLNQHKEQFYIGYSNLNIINNDSTIDFIIQFFKKSILMFISYYWLSFLLAVLLLISNKSLSKVFRLELFVFLLLCYFCSTLIYAKFNKIGDAYQFLTNVFGPFVLALIIYLLIQTPTKSLSGKLKLTALIIVSILGAKEIIGGNNVFHSTSRINYYDKVFISEIKIVLPQLKYPFGVIYYGEDLQNNSREDFPQHNTTFLKLFGRYYDAFNIESDSLKMDYLDKSNQKVNLYIKKNALNIWHYNLKTNLKSNRQLSRKDFYNSYPFSFCVSKKSKKNLPDYIQSDIVRTIKDNKSQIYFYILKKK
ncbi:hypothetical protein [Flavobacterium sp. CAN_S2]|uniref:hypothetical protein n=1 Tax=Flavobacterium sp. CAN_S2 TaxID=2787726 RepID=UPI0018CBB70F